MTKTTVRVLDPDDLTTAGRLIYRAFAAGFRRYGYAEPVTDVRAGTALAAAVYAADPGGALLLESSSGRPLGAGFFQRCSEDAFIGPVAIDPDAQGRGHGRFLLNDILERIGDTRSRLLQDAFNPVSFRLYTRAGFAVRETLALMVTGPGGPHPVPFALDGQTGDTGGVWSLRDIDTRDLQLLIELDREANGADRGELIQRVSGRMRGVILDGPERPRGFACAFPGNGLWVIGPGWAEEGRTLAAIIVGLAQRCARDREAVAVFAPASDTDLLSPLMDVGFRISHLVNVMVKGDFEPGKRVHLPILPIDTTSEIV